MSDLTYVKVEWDAELVVVTIDRAEKLNALNADVVRELGEVFSNLREDGAVRGVVVTGAGERAFVAGADIQCFQGNEESVGAVAESDAMGDVEGTGEGVFELSNGGTFNERAFGDQLSVVSPAAGRRSLPASGGRPV